MRALSRLDIALLSLCLALFLFFGAAWISLPGPQQDELLHISVLIPRLRGLETFSLKTKHHQYPLMMMPYVGALKGWLLWLWFRVVPMGVVGYRGFGIAAGAVTVWLIFWFVRRHYGDTVSLLTTGLIATDPVFVQGIRLDYGPVALMHLLKVGGLCLLSIWLASRSRWAAAAGMFLFGLALWDKANFAWFLAGLSVTMAILFSREAIARLRAQPQLLLIACAAFLIGAAPLLVYNWKRHGETWRERGRFEVRWFKLIEASKTFNGRFMLDMTAGDQYDNSPPAADVFLPGLSQWMYRLGRLRQTITLPLLAAALALLPLNLRLTRSRRSLLFPLLLSALTYACMFFSRDGGASAHHVIMIQPFPMLFLAVSLWTPAERRPSLAARAAATVVVLAAIAVNISLNARHLAVYTRTGGTRAFSDAIYRLVPYLARNSGWRLYAMDWGFSNPVAFLGRRWNLRVDDFFFAVNGDSESSRINEEQLARLMRDPGNVFLLHSPPRVFFPNPGKKFFALASSGIPMREIAEFRERSGEVVYQIYRCEEPDSPGKALSEVEVRFTPQQVVPRQQYTIEVREIHDSWIDLVYDVNQTRGAANRFCYLDAQGRAKMTVPAGYPAATVRILRIRPSGGEWRPARGSITVVGGTQNP
jgi:4-amino-4-deoxy-L-arabinose transferase-like glycosyltransferase